MQGLPIFRQVKKRESQNAIGKMTMIITQTSYDREPNLGPGEGHSAWVSTQNFKKGGTFRANARKDHFRKTLFNP